MSYLEELLPEFRKGDKITNKSTDKSFFVQMRRDNGIMNSYGEHYSFDFSDFMSDEWELYQEPIDWQYVIDHKCLCAFWNKKGCEVLGFLKQRRYYKDNDFFAYISLPGAIYTGCRPVRRDEVTFYEDKEK